MVYIADSLLEKVAERLPIILKNCSMLGDIYNAQKNASIIYLGLVHSMQRGREEERGRDATESLVCLCVYYPLIAIN